MTNEQAAQRRAALEEEKRGYERRLALAKKEGDTDQVSRLNGRIKGVDAALAELQPANADLKVDEVLELVGDDPAKAAEALAAEKAGKGRKTLIEGLEAIIEGGEE